MLGYNGIGFCLCAFLLGLIIGRWFGKGKNIGVIRVNNMNDRQCMFFEFNDIPANYCGRDVSMKVVYDANYRPDSSLGKDPRNNYNPDNDNNF